MMPETMPVRWLEPYGPIGRIFFESPTLPTTVCLLHHAGDTLLIDTGLPGGADALVECLAARDVRVDHVFLSHHHVTHTAGVAALRAYCSPRVWCHEIERPLCEGQGVDIDDTFSEGTRLAGCLDVLHAPGHTPGNVAFYWAAEQALFAGDVVMGLGPSEAAPLCLPGAWDEASKPQVRRDAARLAAFACEALLPAHGRQFASRGHAVLRDFRATLTETAS